MRPSGYVIDVPVTLTVAIRGDGLGEDEAKQMAREFAYSLAPSTDYITDYNHNFDVDNYKFTEVSLESSLEDECEVLEELEADDLPWEGDWDVPRQQVPYLP